MVFGKGADILFSKPVISLKSEVKIVNVTEEAKRECECGAGQPGEGANRQPRGVSREISAWADSSYSASLVDSYACSQVRAVMTKSQTWPNIPHILADKNDSCFSANDSFKSHSILLTF